MQVFFLQLPLILLSLTLALAIACSDRGGPHSGREPQGEVSEGAVHHQAARASRPPPGGAQIPDSATAAPASHENEARFGKAVELARSGRHAEALPFFLELEGKMGPLEGYLLYYLSASLMALGKPADARKYLDKLAALYKGGGAENPRIEREARLMAAEACSAQGLWECAAAGFEKAIEDARAAGEDPSKAALLLAESFRQAGKTLRARQAYAEVIRKYPWSDASRKALDEYTKLTPGFTMPEAWRYERIEALERKRMYAEALAEIEAVKEPTDKEKRWQYLYKKASLLYQARSDYNKALGLLTRLLRGKSELGEKAMLLAAGCKKRAGDVRGARMYYQFYLKRYPKGTKKGEALLNLLSLDMQEGRWKFVQKNYQRFTSKRSFLNDEERRTVLWSLGLAYFADGRWKEAGEIFALLRKSPPDVTERARAEYWHAATFIERGKKKEAAERLKDLVQSVPLHYYAMLAVIRLREMGEDASIPPLPKTETEVAREVGQGQLGEAQCEMLPGRARALLKAGLLEEAREELTLARKELSEKYAADPDLLLRLYECAAVPDILYGAMAVKLGKYTSFYPYKDILPFWRILYPLARMEVVDSSAKRFGIDPYLVLAIMRQESSFNQEAISSAGAMGLMQLMPRTASKVADLLGEEYDRQKVMTTETNVRYGVFYLSKLKEKFGGKDALAVAAYNGGPKSVSSWLERKWTSRMDLFVELIPFSQTRNYVRRVATSYARYHYLYGGTIEPVLKMLSTTPTPSVKKEPSF